MLVDGGDQEVTDPAESQPNGRAAYYRNHERANCRTRAESSFDSHRQCGQQCQRNTIIEKTLAFQERGEPGIGAELAEGGQHGDRISCGYHRPEEQRHGPRQPECPMDEHTPDNHRQEHPRNGEHEDAVRTLHRRRRSRTKAASKRRGGRNKSKMISEFSVGAEIKGRAPRPRPKSSSASVYGRRIHRAITATTAAAISRTTSCSMSPTAIAPIHAASHTAKPLGTQNGDRQLAVPSVARVGKGYAAPPSVLNAQLRPILTRLLPSRLALIRTAQDRTHQ